MSTIKLPELPIPDCAGPPGWPEWKTYSRDQMRAYAEEAVRQALAAQVPVAWLYHDGKPGVVPDPRDMCTSVLVTMSRQPWCRNETPLAIIPETSPGHKPAHVDTSSGHSAPVAREYTSAMGEAAQAYMDSFPFAHKLPAQFRWADLWTAMYGASHAGEALRDADVPTLLAFIFERFGQPGDAGELPDSVIAAVRRLERSTLSTPPEPRDG